jgi:hypothetical protein
VPNADRRPLTLALVIALALPFVAMAGPANATTGPVTMRVSVASDGTQGDAGSYGAEISAGGGYVVFSSNATNLFRGT